MKRLNDRAFDILQTEIRQCTKSDVAGQVQCELALCRLEKLRLQFGSPLTHCFSQSLTAKGICGEPFGKSNIDAETIRYIRFIRY
jgi:hypothetical protein